MRESIGSGEEKLTPLPWFPLLWRRLPLDTEGLLGEGAAPFIFGGVAGFDPFGGLELRRFGSPRSAGALIGTAVALVASECACPFRGPLLVRGDERVRRSLSDDDDFIGALVGVFTRGDDR